jgi:sugar (pentulose or hexulose) kinase
VILTVDLGTSFTKVGLWGSNGLRALGRAALSTMRPEMGWAEQNPASWWESVLAATASAKATSGVDDEAMADVDVVACCGARQTFVLTDADGRPTGPGILWSDRRATAEVGSLLARSGGADAVHAHTGGPLAAESVAAKLAWLARHRPEQLQGARWVLTPRDFVVAKLSGEFCTDDTMASRSGLYDLDGQVVGDLAGPATSMLPPVVGSDTVVGGLGQGAADELGVPTGTPVVIGAGDRASEVIGTGAHPLMPMVSWGTTASVVVPVGPRSGALVPGMVLSRAAGAIDAGWLLEGGLSAAGALLDWLAALCRRPLAELLAEASARSPGARGVMAVPWLGGARAPWWNDQARAGFVGASADHDSADFTRAAVESVAAEVRRCLVAAAPAVGDGVGHRGACSDTDASLPFEALTLGGRGSADVLWPVVLSAVCGLPVVTRRSGEAASAGAAWLGARGIGAPIALDDLDPPVDTLEPDAQLVATYAPWRKRADRVAEVLNGLDLGPIVRVPQGEECETA